MLDAVARKLPERWVAMAAPAVLFWAGAVLAWMSSGRDRTLAS